MREVVDGIEKLGSVEAVKINIGVRYSKYLPLYFHLYYVCTPVHTVVSPSEHRRLNMIGSYLGDLNSI